MIRKDLVPEGCTRTPKPVIRSSQAIQGREDGSRESTERLVSLSLTLAVLLEGELKTFGHAVMGKTMTLTEDRLAPTECGVGMVVLFIVTL